MRRFYSPPETFASEQVTLGADETRHLRTVLRLVEGDEVSVFDGAGREFLCSVKKIGKQSSSLDILTETTPASPESPFAITVAATVLNGEKYDLIVQKAVELGVVTLIPLHTIRCDVKPSDAAKRLERWRRIAMEATKQTGRAKLMQIAEPVTFPELMTDRDAAATVMFSEREGGDFSAIDLQDSVTAIYGPKGGWDDAELKAAQDIGLSIVTLGGRIMRAETASIAITAILQHRFGDLQ